MEPPLPPPALALPPPALALPPPALALPPPALAPVPEEAAPPLPPPSDMWSVGAASDVDLDGFLTDSQMRYGHSLVHKDDAEGLTRLLREERCAPPRKMYQWCSFGHEQCFLALLEVGGIQLFVDVCDVQWYKRIAKMDAVRLDVRRRTLDRGGDLRSVPMSRVKQFHAAFSAPVGGEPHELPFYWAILALAIDLAPLRDAPEHPWDAVLAPFVSRVTWIGHRGQRSVANRALQTMLEVLHADPDLASLLWKAAVYKQRADYALLNGFDNPSHDKEPVWRFALMQNHIRRGDLGYAPWNHAFVKLMDMGGKHLDAISHACKHRFARVSTETIVHAIDNNHVSALRMMCRGKDLFIGRDEVVRQQVALVLGGWDRVIAYGGMVKSDVQRLVTLGNLGGTQTDRVDEIRKDMGPLFPDILWDCGVGGSATDVTKGEGEEEKDA